MKSAAWWRHDCRLSVRELPSETLVCDHCGARKPSAASLRWHYEDGTWWAESPEFPEWSGGASSLDEARLLAHEGLRFCAENDALTIIDPFGELPASVTW